MGVSIPASFTRGGSGHRVATNVDTPMGKNTMIIALTVAHGPGHRRPRQVLSSVLGKQSCLKFENAADIAL